MPGARALAAGAALALSLIAASSALATTPPAENGLVTFEDGAGVNGGNIWTVRADGSDPRQLTHESPPTYLNYPNFSANGQRIFFVRKSAGSPDQIWSMALDGTDQRMVFSVPQPDRVFSLVVSPDGRRLVFSRADGSGEDLWRIGVDGSGAVDITNTKTLLEEVTGWSADGRRIAFWGCDGPVNPCDIYVINPDGTDMRDLTKTPAIQEAAPSFSPDGRKLTFTRFDSSNDIWTMNADGSGPLDLTAATGKTLIDNFPVFSADGTQIYFERGSVSYDLFSVPAGGGAAINLTATFAPDVSDVDTQSIQRCGKRQATIVGDDGANSITGTNRSDVIVANADTDKVNGRGGKDLICGGAGKDRLKGGKGKDRLIGGGGKDRCIGGGGRDKAKGCEKDKGIP